ncbi:MAG: ribosome-binding factor A [Gammaproteobacteria bacterium RIFCSPHIGHO2_12_FULL_45_9]|nr:MAG: ribosome-binding factor A [Gammaproteobacteria bacterium RIFCSPHIGHO2_12_FULL_45_9]
MRVAQLLKRDVRDPRLAQVVITRVDMSPDLKQAKIFFTQLTTETLPETEKAFDKASGFLRTRLAECITQRHVPKLVFVYDGNVAYSETIAKVIDVAVAQAHVGNEA